MSANRSLHNCNTYFLHASVLVVNIISRLFFISCLLILGCEPEFVCLAQVYDLRKHSILFNMISLTSNCLSYI